MTLADGRNRLPGEFDIAAETGNVLEAVRAELDMGTDRAADKRALATGVLGHFCRQMAQADQLGQERGWRAGQGLQGDADLVCGNFDQVGDVRREILDHGRRTLSAGLGEILVKFDAKRLERVKRALRIGDTFVGACQRRNLTKLRRRFPKRLIGNDPDLLDLRAPIGWKRIGRFQRGVGHSAFNRPLPRATQQQLRDMIDLQESLGVLPAAKPWYAAKPAETMPANTSAEIMPGRTVPILKFIFVVPLMFGRPNQNAV